MFDGEFYDVEWGQRNGAASLAESANPAPKSNEARKSRLAPRSISEKRYLPFAFAFGAAADFAGAALGAAFAAILGAAATGFFFAAGMVLPLAFHY
jgi:hypothetical protein